MDLTLTCTIVVPDEPVDEPPLLESQVAPEPTPGPPSGIPPGPVYQTINTKKWYKGLSGNAGDVLNFKAKVTGETDAKVIIRNIKGDADLYVTFDQPNVIGAGVPSNDCKKTRRLKKRRKMKMMNMNMMMKKKKNKEICQGMKPGGAEYIYVTVYGNKSFHGVQLKIIA